MIKNSPRQTNSALPVRTSHFAEVKVIDFVWKCSLFFSICMLSTPASGQLLRTVALSGQHAPGTEPGVTYRFFNDPPVINYAGHTAFEAHLNDANQNILGEGIWSEGSGTLDLIALEGMQAPDAPIGAKFVSFSIPVLNDSGKLVFAGRGTPRSSFSGLFTHQSGNTHAVILDGNQAPGTSSGVVFDALINGISLLNGAGDVASKFFIEGNGVNSSNDIVIWYTSSGTLGLVARDGNQAPGTPDGVQFNISGGEPVLNDAGELAFSSSLVGPAVDSTNNSGIWSGTPGILQLVTRKGNHAPGTLGEVKFAFFGGPSLNVAGHTAFFALLTGNGVDSTNDRGIWSEGSGSLELVARRGEQAAGTIGDVDFSAFNSPVLNNAGQVALRASLSGSSIDPTNRNGIWSGTAGKFNLVVRSGSQAPGTPNGAEFEDFGTPVLNAKGLFAFAASLFIPRQIGRDDNNFGDPNGGVDIFGDPNGGVDSMNDNGLWATDLEGNLHLIAREGDLLEVGPDDFRIISSLDFAGSTGNGDGRPSGFNDRGQVAFSAFFNDGSSGIFVSNLVAVPEPANLSLVLMGIMVFCVCGCSRQR